MRLYPGAVQHPSPNHGGPLKNPTLLVIHYTAGRSLAGSTEWLCSPSSKASAHLIIGRDGVSVNQLVPLDQIAWHAGQSQWKGHTGVNSFSIGIELDHTGPVVKGGDGVYRSPTTGIVVDASDVIEANHKNGGSWHYWTIYPQPQLRMLENICREIVAAYPSITECVGHDDVAPGRKCDVGPAFDMGHLNSVVFGRA